MGFPYHTPVTNTVAITAKTTATELIGPNEHRRGVAIHNASTSVLYIKAGDTVTTSLYTHKLYPNDLYETPYGYSGPVSGIWASATGSALITEFS